MAHAQRKCHSLSAHLLASLPEFQVTIATSKPHLFFNLNFMPVTLSPRYFGMPSYQSLKCIYNTIYLEHKTQACITSKQGWWMQNIE